MTSVTEKDVSGKTEQEFVTVRSEHHEYKVPILDTLDGIGFATSHPDLFVEEFNREQLESAIARKIVNQDFLFSFTMNLLPQMKIDDIECDDIGMCSLFRRKPIELYRAILVSLMANFGDCFPFLEELSGTTATPSQQ